MFETILDRLAEEDAVAALPPVPDAITLTVVVPTYRRPQGLERLLGALEKQVVANPRYSVVVVNDGTHDADYQRVVDRYGHFMEYHALPQNCGPARARNEAAQRAKGAFLVFTDDDCEPPAHWLDRLAAILEASPFLAVVGGATRPPESLHPGVFEQFLKQMNFFPRPVYGAGTLICLPTANLVVRKDWFEAVGGFDPRFRYAAGEDLNLTFRLRQAGASMRVESVWYTRHDLEYRVRDFLKRYYSYGFGNMQHTLLCSDTAQQNLYPYTALWEILWYELHAVDNRCELLAEVKPWFKRWFFAVLLYWRRVCYQRGGMDARREFANASPNAA